MDGTLLAADEIGPSFVPRLRDGVVSVPVQDESVLYEEDTGSLHQLDAIATLVCGLFDGQTSIQSMAQELASAFEADPHVIERDVLDLARDLGRRGLLVQVRAEEDAADGR